ncbi:MAG: hypothetical protein R3211_03520 [Balneolaceae bacterium]|nr:hypothetical protein [Balneolaceae bacterium]
MSRYGADTENRITAIVQAVENWLDPDNEYLARAFEQTVEEGYFGAHDVKHAIRWLKQSVNREAVDTWLKQSNIDKNHDSVDENVLCLHAGNLPLVGFQDAFATLLSGARYTGKISRKDPYLLPTFLNEVKKTNQWSSVDVQWVHRLDDLEGMQNDAILFAGSPASVPDVMDAVERYDLTLPDTRYLVRTAHFSVAWIDNREPNNMEELVEAIFRYGGKGCRSVALVVSPFGLDDIKCELTDYIESFWLHNPQHDKPAPKLKYRFAYNKSVERSQAWLDHFLLQQGGLELDQDFICYWVEGDRKKAGELARSFGKDLQSIYVTDPQQTIPGLESRTELLGNAQQPPLYWKPDGVDTLEWLLKD